MKFSIITINRNNSEGLYKTMLSVFEQTYRDFEYIVVDGASTDGSVEVIQRFADVDSRGIKFSWLSEPDTGIFNAMNKGISRAHGEYCLFLNSGDCLANDKVIEQVYTSDLKDDIVYGLQLTDNNGDLEISSFYDPKDISFRTFMHSSLPHQCTFIKRNLFSLVGSYNEKNKIVSDWEFNMLALFKYNASLTKLSVPIAIYDTNGISSDSNYQRLHAKEKRNVLDTHFPRIMRDMDRWDALEKSRTYRCMMKLRHCLIWKY